MIAVLCLVFFLPLYVHPLGDHERTFLHSLSGTIDYNVVPSSSSHFFLYRISFSLPKFCPCDQRAFIIDLFELIAVASGLLLLFINCFTITTSLSFC